MRGPTGESIIIRHWADDDESGSSAPGDRRKPEFEPG